MPLKLLIFGAHPDDAEFHSGGLAAMYCAAGHCVKMVSVTDGRSGHHKISGDELVAIRRREAAASAQVIGATSEVWDFPDGELEPTLDVRRRVIAEIRKYKPDLVLTHRTNDYHPDHRAVADVVRDASYMVTVPPIVPDVAALRSDPVVAFMPDRFTKPNSLAGDVVLDVTDQMDTIVQMMASHVSQFFEWLAYNQGISDSVPDSAEQRFAWLRQWYTGHLRPMADRYRTQLIETYGPERGAQIEYVEVYEISEYAAQPDAARLKRLFLNR